MNKLLSVLAACGFGFTAFLAHAQYTVTDLGLLPVGYSRDFANGLNSLGEVAGYVTDASFDNQAIRWTSGGGYDLLGDLGGDNSFGFAINDDGVVVGTSDTGVGFNTRPFRHAPGGSMQSLGTLGGEFGVARDINSLGQITGNASNGSTIRAFIWKPGLGMADVGNFTPAGSSSGQAINAAGHIAGHGTTAMGEQHAFYWDGVTMFDLQTIGTGDQTSALGMNDGNTVVGYGELTPSGSTYGAFKWTSGGGIVQLDQLFSYDTRARDVNIQGDIVGSSWIDGMGNSRAVLWKGGGAVANLNALIPGGSGWLLTNATGINDDGQIVGVGTLNGASRAFLLTPVPEPTALALCAGAIVWFSVTRREPA